MDKIGDASGGGGEGRDAHAHARVLIVDDDELICKLVQRIVSGVCEVVTARHARGALDLLTGGLRVDVLVVDVHMPGMSGIELYRALLESDPGLARHTIFMTGGSLVPEIDRFLQTTPNARLDKPFSSMQLRNVVRSELQACGWSS